MRAGRAAGPLAVGDRGQAAVLLMRDGFGILICIFESSQLEGSYIGDLL